MTVSHLRRSLVLFLGLCLFACHGRRTEAQQFFRLEPTLEESRGEAELPELETDRDAFTPATSTVGSRLTVLETSYSFIDNRRVAETHSLPELLLRRGIGDAFELRLGWNYEVGGAGNIVSGNSADEEAGLGGIERESQLLYGFKARLTEQRGLTPRSAVILQGFTPTSGASPATDYSLAYAFGWELSRMIRLDSSLRYGSEHDRSDVFNQWAPSIALRAALDERWHAHIEYFGIYSDGAERDFSRAFVSPGAHYLITENIELGLRLGWGLTDDSPHFFSNVGLGWRF